LISHWDPVSVALGVRGEDRRTRASPGMELNVVSRPDVPTLDPKPPKWANRTGTGGFDSPPRPGLRCGSFESFQYRLAERGNTIGGLA
jgi:hypothetical protein